MIRPLGEGFGSFSCVAPAGYFMNSFDLPDRADFEEHRAGADDSTKTGSILVELMEECLIKLEAGEPVDRDALVAAHPELTSQIDACLASLQFIHQAVQPTEGMPTRLADFRIIREIGRGGMGVVYEAEQLSLKRPVALKVLRFGSVADPDAMQRFQREAETVASLHHTNIVPVFAVGVEQSINYYAMQLIQGRCLRDIVLDKSQWPIPDKTVAKWGLQAAEALAHAHERNVVHRDIKPSNLILGEDGRIWLTDFGLAKRLDDVTLSLCGALVGTPRYMSPEQASAMRRPVDHRTDIYSLGATLYELVTGRPLFESESPHVVISQILSVEPKPPREFAPKISRDLETIILKCLCKDASRRYQTARELADDLRAFEEGRAIRARRATPLEQTRRWVKRNRRQLATAAVAVVATIALLLGGSQWWQLRQAWRLATLKLNTQKGPLTAEVLTSGGDLVVPPFTVPNEQPLSIPEGEYRLRVSGRGAFSKTAWMTVKPRQSLQLNVDLDHREIYPPIGVGSVGGYEFVDFGNDLDLIVLPDTPNKPDFEKVGNRKPNLLRRVDAATGKDVWSLDISQNSPALQAMLPTDEMRSHWWTATVFGWKLSNQPPLRVLRPLPDLDADGVPDLVWLHHRGYSLFAVSGKTGQPLWWMTTLNDGKSELQPQFDQAVLTTIDQGEGGTRPVIVLLERRSDSSKGTLIAERVVAIDARDRSPLWTHDLPAAQAQIAVAAFQESKQAQAIPRLVVIQSEGKLRTLDLATGKPRGEPMSLDPADDPHQPGYSMPEVVDLDGDGLPEVLQVRGEPSSQPSGIRVVSLSLQGPVVDPARPNWFTPFAGDTPKNYVVQHQDLNGDGVVEILATSERFEFDCRVLDGRNGHEVWRRRHRSDFFNGRHSPTVIGDDLDGDGWREVFALSLEPNVPGLGHDDSPQTLFADCFSGKSGQTRWWSKTSVAAKANAFLHPFAVAPRWTSQGLDGQPALLVTAFLQPKFPEVQGYVVSISAVTGAVQEVATGLASPQGIDLNNDGREELVVVSLADHGEGSPHDLNNMPGELRFLQNDNPIGWRRYGSWQPLTDLDGDGLSELWQPNHRSGGELPIISGRDGALVTNWNDRQRTRNFVPMVDPLFDANGDGIPELLSVPDPWYEAFMDRRPPVSNELGVALVSPKGGRRIWSAPEVPLPKWAGLKQIHLQVATPLCRDLDGDQELDLVVPYIWQTDRDHNPATPARCQYCVALLDARTGRLKWQSVLMEEQQNEHHLWTGGSEWLNSIKLGDLNADQVQDIVIGLAATPWHSSWQREMVVQAINGRDGRLLWPEFRAKFHHPKRGLENLLQIQVADVDGQPGEELIRLDFIAEPKPDQYVVDGNWTLEVLHGATGQPRFAHVWPGKMQSHATVSDLQQLLVLREPDRSVIVVTKATFEPQNYSQAGLEDWLFSAASEPASATPGPVQDLAIREVRQASRDDHSWIFDLNADGRDELLTSRRLGNDETSELMATRGLKHELWKRSIPRLAGYSRATLKRLDGGKSLLVSTGQMNQVLDTDGNLLTQFATPKDAGTDIVSGSSDWIDRLAAGTLPRVILPEGSQTRSDIIRALDRDGKVLPLVMSENLSPPHGVDQRYLRELPWNQNWMALSTAMTMVSSGIALWLLLVAPGGLWRWFRQQRQAGRSLLWPGIATIAWLLAVWPIAGSFVRILSVTQLGGPQLAHLGLLVLMGLPLSVAPPLLTRWIRNRNFRPLIRIAIVALVSTVVLAAVMLFMDVRLLHSSERYRWSGWYQAMFPGTCIGLWVSLAARWLWIGSSAILQTGSRILRGGTV